MNVDRLQRLTSGAISIADAKLHARIDGDDEEPTIKRLCAAAVIEFEDRAQVALLSQAVRVRLAHWPSRGRLVLPIGPVLSPIVITITAGGRDLTGYNVTTGLRPSLQLTEDRPAGPVEVEYIAGFGDETEDVPADIRAAILDQVVRQYDARGGDPKALPLSPQFARVSARYRGVRA